MKGSTKTLLIKIAEDYFKTGYINYTLQGENGNHEPYTELKMAGILPNIEFDFIRNSMKYQLECWLKALGQIPDSFQKENLKNDIIALKIQIGSEIIGSNKKKISQERIDQFCKNYRLKQLMDVHGDLDTFLEWVSKY